MTMMNNIQEIIKNQSPSPQEAIHVIQEYLTDINREDVEFAKFISSRNAGDIFEHVKMSKMNVHSVMNNPSMMMSTVNDFFSYCYNIAVKHFKEKFEMGASFRVFDTNGNFIYQY